MICETVIATKEQINCLRAKQRTHELKEIQCAEEIQRHIIAQSEIEDKIIAWEIHLHNLKKAGL